MEDRLHSLRLSRPPSKLDRVARRFQMATAIEKLHSFRAITSRKHRVARAKAEPTCVLESLQNRGLRCELCTSYTVVGPVQIIQPKCPVVELVKAGLANHQVSGGFPVAAGKAELLDAGVQRGALQSQPDSSTIFSPYDAMGLAERREDVHTLGVHQRKR